MYDLLENAVADFSDIKYIKIRNLTFPVLCPLCGQELSIEDSKRRYVKDELGRKIPFNLKRYYCSFCKRIHTEIPDIVQPYKQYETLTIDGAEPVTMLVLCSILSSVHQFNIRNRELRKNNSHLCIS